MSNNSTRDWTALQNEETNRVVAALSTVFSSTDAYQFNPASIRVRVIDPQFEGKSAEERDALIERVLQTLPEDTQSKIINVYTFAPRELQPVSREYLLNEEFEHPGESML
jgi:stress-induced morphogen